MQEGKTIGLNETKLGLVAPFFFTDMMISAIGTRQAELALGLGSLFTAEDALRLGENCLIFTKVAANSKTFTHNRCRNNSLYFVLS